LRDAPVPDAPTDPLEAFVDRYVPRDLANVPGRYTVLRRQALRDLRAFLAAEREACAAVCDWWAAACEDSFFRDAAREMRARGDA
jgi:hypothetical protein